MWWAKKKSVMYQSNLKSWPNNSKKCQISNYVWLNLVEYSGEIVPNINNIKDCTPDELWEIMVGLKTSRQSHQPFCLVF